MQNTNKKIIIVPIGGLANRMRAIASAYVYSQELSLPLEVVWHKNTELNASFEDLFETSNLPFFVSVVSSFKYNVVYELPRKRNFFLSRLTALAKGITLLNIFNDESKLNLSEKIQKAKKDVLIHSGLQFADLDHHIISSLFKFSSKVLKAKRSILNNKHPLFAIQIRRSDNIDSIMNSPLHLFENIIEERLKEDSSSIFFLATDDAEVKSILTDRYPTNILYNPKPARRDTLEGMVDAAAEMSILSHCSIIYGSYWSSFPELAAFLGDTELKVLKDNSIIV